MVIALYFGIFAKIRAELSVTYSCVANSDADSMPTFDDLDKILNASGIAADALTINSMADSSDVCKSGMCALLYNTV